MAEQNQNLNTNQDADALQTEQNADMQPDLNQKSDTNQSPLQLNVLNNDPVVDAGNMSIPREVFEQELGEVAQEKQKDRKQKELQNLIKEEEESLRKRSLILDPAERKRQAFKLTMQKIKNEAKQQELDQIESQAKEQAQLESLKANVAEYMQNKLEAQEMGAEFPEDPKLEQAAKKLAQQEAQEAQEIEQALNPTEPSPEEIEAAAAPIRQDVAQVKAAQEVQTEEALKQQEKSQKIENEIEQENKKYATNYDEYWANKTTGQKILGKIALVLGGIGQGMTGGNSNVVLNMIQDEIKNDIQAKKLAQEEAAAAEQMAFRAVEQKLKQMSSGLRNQKTMLEMQNLMQGMRLKQQEIVQQRAFQKSANQGDGLDIDAVRQLPEKQRELMVEVEGKFYPALSKSGAAKLRQEVIPQTQSNLRALRRLREIADEPFGGAFSLGTRAEAEQLSTALAGGLRLELFGPGVMTDSEREVAKGVIGNPAKIFALSPLEKRKLNTLMFKLEQGTRDKMRAEGLPLPKNQNEMAIDKMMKSFKNKNEKVSRPEIITALMKAGKWNFEQESF